MPKGAAFEPSREAKAEAAKLARYANSALDFADVDEAVGYLKEAISQLTRPPPGTRRAK